MCSSVTSPLVRKKVYLSRDYGQGMSVRFQNIFPQELVGFIETEKFLNTVNTINGIFRDAESISTRTFIESCIACLTAYLVYYCMDSHYDKCLKKVSAFVRDQNETVWKPRGLLLTDPSERGLRVIEISIIQADRNPGDMARFANQNATPHMTQHTMV